MRCSSALVLSTLAVGQAAAANLRHASFHARRSNEKREAPAVDWSRVTLDLKNVDWSKIDWNSVFNEPTPTPEPEPEPPVQPVETPAPRPAPAPKPAEPQAPKPKEPKPVEHVTNDILSGLDSFVKKLGIISTGTNARENNGGIWLGASSRWSAEFTNDGPKDIKVFCWESKGFSGMSLNVNKPAIAINLAPGASQNVSFAENVPSSCAPADENTSLALFGGIENTWWEVTYGPMGAFDVSRNVWMRGTNIHSQGSKCVSDMETCVYKCKDSSLDSCEKGYDLYNCDSSNGGGGGYDPIMDGTGGGCAMGSNGEHVRVTFS